MGGQAIDFLHRCLLRHLVIAAEELARGCPEPAEAGRYSEAAARLRDLACGSSEAGRRPGLDDNDGRSFLLARLLDGLETDGRWTRAPGWSDWALTEEAKGLLRQHS